MSYVGYIGPSKVPKYEQLTRGQHVLLSRGSYSDYTVTGVFKCLQDFDLYKELKDFAKGMTPDQREYWTSAEISSAVTWRLMRRGLIEELQVQEIHLGDSLYGDSFDGSDATVQPINQIQLPEWPPTETEKQ